jgi:hypothetical protein
MRRRGPIVGLCAALIGVGLVGGVPPAGGVTGALDANVYAV